jgi:hypothetical protein
MTHDDSPSLGGHSPDDNAPMISSVLTHAIADARGAYLAGNLDALIGHMSTEQRIRFRQLLLEMALYFLEGVPDDERDEPYRSRALDAAQAYLAAATPEAASAAVQAARRVHHVGEGPWHDPQYVLDDFSLGIVHILDSTLLASAYTVRRTSIAAHFTNSLTGAALYSIFKQRQIEAAWHLLQRREHSLARPVMQAEIDAALADAALLYRDHHLLPLSRLMSVAQQMRFKQAVVHQALDSAEALWQSQEIDADVRALLDAARRWLHIPDADSQESARTLTARLPDHRRVPIRSTTRPDEGYRAAYYAARAAAQPDPHEAARQAINAIYPGGIPEGPHFNGLSTGRQWMLDAAWAILHDQDPPPIKAGR